MADNDLNAALCGQIAALATLVGLLVDKGILTPEDVVSYFDQGANEALASLGGATAAEASQTIADFVKARTGASGPTPS